MNIIETALKLVKTENPFQALEKTGLGDVFVGYGRNLTDNPITTGEAAFLLLGDIERALDYFLEYTPEWNELSEENRSQMLADRVRDMNEVYDV